MCVEVDRICRGEANQAVLEAYPRSVNLVIDNVDSYEFALDNVAPGQLAIVPRKTKSRPELTAEDVVEVKDNFIRANNRRLKDMNPEQLRAELQETKRLRFTIPEFIPPFTARQFKQMSAAKVRNILYSPNGQTRLGVQCAVCS